MQTRTCSKCKIDLSLDNFYRENKKANKYKYRYSCKKCDRISRDPVKRRLKYYRHKLNNPRIFSDRAIHWRAKKKLEDPDYMKRIRKRYKDKAYEASIKRKYGVDLSWYEKQYNNQSGKCAICFKSFLLKVERTLANKRQYLYIDHNHSSGKVRGLLCDGCNHVLGFCKDNIDTLKSAIQYLLSDGVT